MSRYFNSFMDDSSEDLEHSWGTSPKAKAREKEYNHWYYQKHKDEFAAIRKQRQAAENSYKQAEKSHNDARRYDELADKIDYDYRIRDKYSGRLNANAEDALNNAKRKYENMSQESEAKSRKYKIQGDYQMTSAKTGAKRIRQDIKNPTVKDLVEFYLDTTVAKVKKSANRAKKYATKAMSTAEKAAKKYATKAMPMAEKAAKKVEKYATKTAKSVANKAKKYAVR